MANIPENSNALPGVTAVVETQSRGASVPGGTRIAAIIGEGSRTEVLVSSALGGGKDGLNSSYTSTSNSDGRHFLLSFVPVIAGRTSLYKNGILLNCLEHIIDGYIFNHNYDYRLDSATGKIELQTAYLVDQGGKFYSASSLNVGQGTVGNLTLADKNAPTETWTVKCISVQRDISNNPIQKTAKFIVYGSISGSLLDGYGSQFTWIANGTVASNGILSFSINENQSGGNSISPFREGDSFSIQVKSGSLNKGDSLNATYIAVADLNDPTFFSLKTDISKKHGLASTANTLALGCQLAFANNAPGIMCVQAAPPIPRRTSYELEKNFLANSVNVADFVVPLPLGTVPDPNSEIHVFVTNPNTGVEKQLLPNKYTYYTLGTGGSNPSVNTFVFDNTPAPSGYSYSYSVISQNATINFAQDGYLTALTALTATFSSSTVAFDSSYVGLVVDVQDATNSGNIGSWTITGVSGGVLSISRVSGVFVTEANTTFEILDSSQTSQYLVLNKNIVPAGYSLRITLITTTDSSFYDAGWASTLSSLEIADVDIVVPLPLQTKSAIFQETLSHCRFMSNAENKKERVLFTGAISGLTPDNITGAKLAAVENIGVLEGIQGATIADILSGNTEDLANYSVTNAFGNTYRCVYFYPDQIVVNVGGDNTYLDGFYMAAAAAGYLSGIPSISIPLTNKVLAGFTILKNKQYSPTVQKQIVAAGVSLLTPVAGGGNVVWGKTTTQSGYPEEEEISIVFIRDRIAKSLRTGFAGYIGNPEDDETVLTLAARANDLLTGFVAQKLITDHADLSVVRDAVEPRQWNISVLVQPVYSINWIYIKVSVGLI